VLVVLFAFAGIFGVYAGTLWIYSHEVVHETVQVYTVTLASSNLNPKQGETVVFTATLLIDGMNAGAGKTIHFFVNDVEVDTGITNSDGVATYNWVADVTSDWKVGYLVIP
jgi:hypothetical protein